MPPVLDARVTPTVTPASGWPVSSLVTVPESSSAAAGRTARQAARQAKQLVPARTIAFPPRPGALPPALYDGRGGPATSLRRAPLPLIPPGADGKISSRSFAPGKTSSHRPPGGARQRRPARTPSHSVSRSCDRPPFPSLWNGVCYVPECRRSAGGRKASGTEGVMGGRAVGRAQGEDLAVELANAGATLVAFFRNRLAAPREDVEDLLQDTVLAAWRMLREPGSERVLDVPAYLLGIARHKYHDELRRRRREREHLVRLDGAPARLPPAESSPPEAYRALSRKECRARFRGMLRECRPIERRLLVLRFLHGRPHAEACAMAGIDPVRGSRIVYRALQRLRKRWHECRHEGKTAAG
ncbi:MAG: sigma-70 family RNA polymerase sigma factor [Acidobacteria bacterium]|nr:MAG: sigma-70 family RNA polymerase sigma factor [Acidobacteriota bacterium]